MDGCVIPRVLHSVSSLVAGNADGSDRAGTVHGVGQADDVGARVVVVGQLARDVLNGNAGHTVCAEHGLGGLRGSQSPAGVDPGITVKGRVDLPLCPHGENNARQHQNHIIHIKSIHS